MSRGGSKGAGSVLVPVVPDVLHVVVVLQEVDELLHVLHTRKQRNHRKSELFKLKYFLCCIAQFIMYIATKLGEFMITDFKLENK